MPHPSTVLALAIFALFAPILPAQAAAPPEVHASMGGRLKLLGFGESLNDPFKSGNRIYLFQTQSRLWLDMHLDDYRLFTQVALGGEDAVEAPNPGVALTLLDMDLEMPLLGGTLVAGQFKVPYGREQLTDTGHLQFNGRSIGSLAVQTGRDVGVALRHGVGPASLVAGVFTGGGRDVPAEYIPEVLGIPLLAGRISLGDVDGDTDPYRLHQHEFQADAPTVGVALNGLFMRDSLIGHSTIMNVKTQDTSLLTNPNWNPYLGRSAHAQGNLYQVGLDAALRRPWRGGVLNAEAQLDRAGYMSGLGNLQLSAGHAQLGYYCTPFEVAMRYGLLVPDSNFALYDATKSQGFPISDGTPIQELTPAVTYFLHGDQLKLTLDFPILLNVPVVTETGVGSYVTTDMPNETTPLKSGGSIGNQTVAQARLTLQAAF
jgi:hypothetical protein